MKSFKEFYKGKRPFVDAEAVVGTVKKSKKYDPKCENIDKARKVQLFETGNQKTYLVATEKNIYKVLDDRRTVAPKVSWSRSIEKLAANGRIEFEVQPYKERVGRLVLKGVPEKRNLVSKKLFENIDVVTAIDGLVKNPIK
ncbi:MAG: hypothetical protein KAU27_01930 [Desulfuromonadales bacterium]|nr:hypothetical protein [Desulfuromonadales bacterium]